MRSITENIYIDKSVFTVRSLDLRRRVHYKCKECKAGIRISLSAREFRIGRMYDDFLTLLKSQPNTNAVEMAAVEGGRGNSRQALLTMFFRNYSFMLTFVLEEKTQDHIIKVFVLLRDNSTEFQFPTRLESDKNSNVRTHIYYCSPNSSCQKGMIKKNHSYIRYVIPKGTSLDFYNQDDGITLTNPSTAKQGTA